MFLTKRICGEQEVDTRTYYYFREVTKDMNITKTAARLYMSQQTLSNHILRLESHFGTPLFYRKPTLSLTYAGEIVLSFAENLILRETNLEELIADIRKDEKGLIRFGASAMRTSLCMPPILENFSSRYPNIEMRMTTANSLTLEKMILEGTLDLAIVIETEQQKDLNYIPLMDDPVYLCVTDQLLETYYGSEGMRIKELSRDGANIHHFARIPFCILDNRMGKNINSCFDEAGITPIVYTTSNYIQVTTALGVRGLAASFATKASLKEQHHMFSSDLNIFPLLYHNEPLTQRTFIIRRKNRYVSTPTNSLIESLCEFFTALSEMPVSQL